MKKYTILYFLFAALTLSISMSSCKDDLSTLDLSKIGGVSVDTTGLNSLNVFQFEHLILKPKLITKLNPDDLTYEWKINMAPGSPEYNEIGTGRDLDYEVRLKPTESKKFHQLVYTITDQKTGLQYIMAWPVTIRNSIAEGLVIAETNDGLNTDISHIMSPLVTPLYDAVNVKHNIYSSINGTTIPGLITQMRYTRLKEPGQIMMGITANSIVTMKTLDYTPGPANNDLFFYPPALIKPQALAAIPLLDVYVGDGKLYATYLAGSMAIGVPFSSKYNVPDHIALDMRTQPTVVLSFYDEVNGVFVYQPSFQGFGDRNMYTAPVTNGQAFNPASLPGKINIAAEVTTDRDYLHLLQDKNSSKYGIYVMGAGKPGASNTIIPPYAKNLVDLSSAPEIGQAIHFVLLDNQKVMYYATKNKIYAVMFGASTPQFDLRYTAPAGEEITTLQIYRQADYPMRSETAPGYLPTNNKQLVMSTFSGTEGKVYLLPMTNPGVGNIDAANIKTYGGFKKITAIAPQL